MAAMADNDNDYQGNAAIGCANGVAISLALWLIIAMMIWYLHGR